MASKHASPSSVSARAASSSSSSLVSPSNPSKDALESSRQRSSSSKKASPSDVIFGQPPGSDEASLLYEQLISDSAFQPIASDSGQRNSLSLSGRGSGSSSIGTHSNKSESADSGEVRMRAANDGDRETSASVHATPSSTAMTTEYGIQEDEESVKTLPALFEDSDPEDIVILVADMLNRLMTHNDSLPLHPSSLTRFHSRAAPGITILSYLRRIAKYTSLEKSCMLILLVYIDRVCQRIAGFTICSLTVHRFVCAAVVCSSKALCDAFSTNGHYARVGGISLIELNMLEKEFLNIIDWKLSCSGALLQHYYTSLVRSHDSYRLQQISLPPLPPSMLQNLSPVLQQDSEQHKDSNDITME
ncbi:hypothetical protein L7F22_053923 [Adiantum nelumboides]|nr:hypothetical protein [Adiantum nelumboides]